MRRVIRYRLLVGLVITFWLAGAAICWADGEEGRAPRLELASDRALAITDLPALLGDPEVRRALDSGLTTTFQFRLDVRQADTRVRGGALVEVRYEPWDEVYHLMALGADGRPTRSVESSFDALAERWRRLRLVLVRSLGEPRGSLRPRLELDVIPFSRGEQRDTQRWLADSLDREPSNAESAARSSEERAEALADAVQLLVATSIRRQAILSYDWRPPVATERVAP
ncbi:MAG: hypothetical protein AAGE94_09200 [Acidobacteriota bacterium]